MELAYNRRRMGMGMERENKDTALEEEDIASTQQMTSSREVKFLKVDLVFRQLLLFSSSVYSHHKP
jgi:hypothetical protein